MTRGSNATALLELFKPPPRKAVAKVQDLPDEHAHWFPFNNATFLSHLHLSRNPLRPPNDEEKTHELGWDTITIRDALVIRDLYWARDNTKARTHHFDFDGIGSSAGRTAWEQLGDPIGERSLIVAADAFLNARQCGLNKIMANHDDVRDLYTMCSRY